MLGVDSSLKYNPDNHWSFALYKGLAMCQYTDKRRILNINHDDTAGFRLDTLSTHHLHRSPMVCGWEVLATNTDFANSYPSVLQTTCYNMSATKLTGEMCAGIVKGAGMSKNWILLTLLWEDPDYVICCNHIMSSFCACVQRELLIHNIYIYKWI